MNFYCFPKLHWTTNRHSLKLPCFPNLTQNYPICRFFFLFRPEDPSWTSADQQWCFLFSVSFLSWRMTSLRLFPPQFLHRLPRPPPPPPPPRHLRRLLAPPPPQTPSPRLGSSKGRRVSLISCSFRFLQRFELWHQLRIFTFSASGCFTWLLVSRSLIAANSHYFIMRDKQDIHHYKVWWAGTRSSLPAHSRRSDWQPLL